MRLVLTLDGIDVEITERGDGGPYPWLAKPGVLLLAARAPHIEEPGVGEAANITVELDNTDKQAAQLVGYCVRAAARLYDGDDLYFSGLVQHVEYGMPLALTLEAGAGNALDSDPLPLRTTRALGDYADDTALQHILGDWSTTQFPLIRLSDTRFFAADHPMAVTKVFTARQESFGWQAYLESDESGNTWTIVEFSAPVPQDTEVTACGTGKRDDDTGELIENGADCMRYGAVLAGRDDDFSELRAECSELDIRIAVRIAERVGYRTYIDSVAESIGAMVWHGGARLYPTAADPSPILDLDRFEVSNLRATASLTDTADVLRLAYDRSDASGRALHYIQLSASPQRYGGLAKEVLYPFLRSPGNAEAVGRPALQRLAGEKYGVTFDSTNMAIRPGMWVRPVAHPEWMVSDTDPVIMVKSAEIDNDTNSVAVTGEVIVGRATVTVTAHSLALPDTVEAAVDVAFQDGIATFTITDRDGKPLSHALCSLDGSVPKVTDAQGKVSFPAEPGVHTLDVEAVGYLPFSLEVTL